jgi:tRNA A37 threonylcarbamoyladenosine dehydratase
MSDFDFRFGGLGRLYGATALQRLRAAHVMVVGIGGVGSWVAEALARSGIGALTLVDLDDICVSNINRQLPAMDGTIGRAKVEVMAERIRAIHPECRVNPVLEFFSADNADELLGCASGRGMSSDRGGSVESRSGPDYVVDAIDAITHKCQLLARCRLRGIPVIACGAAGGRRDPTRIQVADLSRATHDRLLSEVRKRLRKDHGFPGGEKPFGIECVYSTEAAVVVQSDGTVCEAGVIKAAPGESRRLNCQSGFGSATFVTGAFGFAAAARVVQCLGQGLLTDGMNPLSS